MKSIWISIGCCLLLALIAGYLGADYYVTFPDDVEKTYVGRDSCIVCHQEQASLFHGSHHDRSMDLATNETVLGNFDDQVVQHHGLFSRMFRDGDRFFVETDGEDGKTQTFEIKYVFGVSPLQQYMVEMPQKSPVSGEEVGRLQVLRESWDSEKKEWFYLNPPDVSDRLQPNDPMHWTSISQRWNTACAECHSTGLEKNFDIPKNSFHTSFSEIDVSCESCHGPGSLHVQLAKQISPFWDRKHGFGLAKLKSTSNIPQVETCAPCHSRRRTKQLGYVAGDRYADFFECSLLQEPLYHADGQIRNEVFVHGSFTQSKMFHKGIRCNDCHDPHSTKVKFNDNRLCTSCHQHPTSKYDTPSHHHHAEGSPGSLCVNCHMPATTYMKVDPRRDHSLRVPRPDMSLKYSTPNACTGCHLKPESLSPKNQEKVHQYLDWIIEAEQGNEEIKSALRQVDSQMNEAIIKWYGESSPGRAETYYEKLAKIRNGADPKTAIDLLGDRTAPTIVRATAAFELLPDDSKESLDAAVKVLKEDEPLLISSALLRIRNGLFRLTEDYVNGIRDFSTEASLVDSVGSLLDHSSYQVRVNAARTYSQIPLALREEHGSVKDAGKFKEAFSELIASFQAEGDWGSTHQELATIYESEGMFEEMERELNVAIDLQPNLSGPRARLASMKQSESRQLKAMLAQAARSGQAMEAGALQSVKSRIDVLDEAVERLRGEEHELLANEALLMIGLPGADVAYYRYGMSCYYQDDLEAAEDYLLRAYGLEPESERYVEALTAFYQYTEEYELALEYGNKLIEMAPNVRSHRKMLNEIKTAAARKQD